ncbi:hypothetical protein [Syntrophus aciditrophicus]|nr:hypothetical protein [Syntrophus aciditrophicus]OPY19063.1 MAG: hypothetical protein A4E74_00170 [Syntrophus sp. PtaB.Bin075]
MLESSLDKISETILNLDEASLSGLWEKYKNKMEHFETSRNWEKSVIIFFLINAVRVKNQIFNEQLIRMQNKDPKKPGSPKDKPKLRLVK